MYITIKKCKANEFAYNIEEITKNCSGEQSSPLLQRNNHRKRGKHMKNNKGITLIALVITVILMLILVGVVVTNVHDGGIFDHAANAVKNTDIANEKEDIQQAVFLALGKSNSGTITSTNFQNALNSQFGGEGNAIAYSEGDSFLVELTNTNRFYSVDSNGKIGDPVTLEPVANAGDITKGGTCTGYSDNPYRIECIEDLVAFSKNVNSGVRYGSKYVVLTKNLDFNSFFSYANPKATYSLNSAQNAYVINDESGTTLRELCTTGQGFIPIGSENNPFCGTFDGQDKIISNIYENYENSTTTSCGFFGRISGTIKNLTITGNYKANKKGAGISSIFSGCMINCINKVNISQKEDFRDMGGLIGWADGKYTIINCINYGNIDCNGNIGGGGFIGTDFGGGNASEIYNCSNLGNVKSMITYCGIGNPAINVTNFYNTGTCNNIGQSSYIYTNCFSLEGVVNTINTSIITEKTEEYMKSQNFVDDLNDFIRDDTTIADKSNWKQWIYHSSKFPAFE